MLCGCLLVLLLLLLENESILDYLEIPKYQIFVAIRTDHVLKITNMPYSNQKSCFFLNTPPVYSFLKISLVTECIWIVRIRIKIVRIVGIVSFYLKSRFNLNYLIYKIDTYVGWYISSQLFLYNSSLPERQ